MSTEERDAVAEVEGRATAGLFIGCGWLVVAVHVVVLGMWLTLAPVRAAELCGMPALLVKAAGFPLLFAAILAFERAVHAFRRTCRLNEEAERLEGQYGDGEMR